jgi:tRNA pseudouridine38-40 synthase
MQRYFIHFAYKGTNYHGWQNQPNAISVQEVLENCLSTILRTNISIVGAGRTDTGVHAKQMYAHFDFSEWLSNEFIKKMNAFLPKDIVVYDLILVDIEAHARFDATSRTYEYHLHTQKDPFLDDLSFYFQQPLQLDKMNEAAKILLTYDDFECFSKKHTDVNTFLCEITEAHWKSNNLQLIFTISANRFLRNMVRAIVGTLLDVGIGKINVNDLHQIIQSKNRNLAGFSVPAHGLFLTQVKYPYISIY